MIMISYLLASHEKFGKLREIIENWTFGDGDGDGDSGDSCWLSPSAALFILCSHTTPRQHL